MFSTRNYAQNLGERLEERNEGYEQLSSVEEIMHHNLEGCVADCHAWVVDENTGHIWDYAPETILKTMGVNYETDTLVRKPFPEKLQEQLLPYIQRIMRLKRESVKSSTRIDEQQYKTMCMNTFGYCFLRVSFVCDDYIDRDLKIVLGSLGLKQPDGTIKYEYG